MHFLPHLFFCRSWFSAYLIDIIEDKKIKKYENNA